MLGDKDRNFKIQPFLAIEELVPKGNFYRQLETKRDLTFVRELVQDRYANLGRPSIDPVVYLKLQLIMFLTVFVRNASSWNWSRSIWPIDGTLATIWTKPFLTTVA